MSIPASAMTSSPEEYDTRLAHHSQLNRALREIGNRLAEDVGAEDMPDSYVRVGTGCVISTPPSEVGKKARTAGARIKLQAFWNRLLGEDRTPSLAQMRAGIRFPKAQVEEAVGKLDKPRTPELGPADDEATQEELETTPPVPDIDPDETRRMIDAALAAMAGRFGNQPRVLNAIERSAGRLAEACERRADDAEALAASEGRKKVERLDKSLLPWQSDPRTLHLTQFAALVKASHERLRAEMYRAIEQGAANLQKIRDILAKGMPSIDEALEQIAHPAPRFALDKVLRATDVSSLVPISSDPSPGFIATLLTCVARGDSPEELAKGLCEAMDGEIQLDLVDIGAVLGQAARTWACTSQSSDAKDDEVSDKTVVRVTTDRMREYARELRSQAAGSGFYIGSPVSSSLYAVYGGLTEPPIDWKALGAERVHVPDDPYFRGRMILVLLLEVNPEQLVFMNPVTVGGTARGGGESPSAA